MFHDGELKTFKEILNELFYDWKMTQNPQLHHEKDGGFWVNKTSIFIREHKAYLTYKMDTYLILPEAYLAFIEFYTHFYADDLEFQDFLDDLEDVWMSEGNEWLAHKDGYQMGDLSITVNPDGSGLRKTKNEETTYSKACMEKIARFSKMIS